jgi:hypothetical protein
MSDFADDMRASGDPSYWAEHQAARATSAESKLARVAAVVKAWRNDERGPVTTLDAIERILEDR